MRAKLDGGSKDMSGIVGESGDNRVDSRNIAELPIEFGDLQEGRGINLGDLSPKIGRYQSQRPER